MMEKRQIFVQTLPNNITHTKFHQILKSFQ